MSRVFIFSNESCWPWATRFISNNLWIFFNINEIIYFIYLLIYLSYLEFIFAHSIPAIQPTRKECKWLNVLIPHETDRVGGPHFNGHILIKSPRVLFPSPTCSISHPSHSCFYLFFMLLYFNVLRFCVNAALSLMIKVRLIILLRRRRRRRRRRRTLFNIMIYIAISYFVWRTKETLSGFYR